MNRGPFTETLIYRLESFYERVSQRFDNRSVSGVDSPTKVCDYPSTPGRYLRKHKNNVSTASEYTWKNVDDITHEPIATIVIGSHL